MRGKMIRRTEDLISEVKKSGKRHGIVVAAANDEDAINTIAEAWRHGVVEPVLVGPKKEIERIAKSIAVDIGKFPLVDAPDSAACVQESIRLVREGTCEIIMKGNVRTADLMGEVLHRKNGLRTDRIVSHVGAFTSPDSQRIMIITDAGINIAPDLMKKRDIILNAVDVMHALGIECPKVAALSFIEKIENKDIHPGIKQSTEDAERLSEMNKVGKITGCVVEGPYALDNAISKYAAEHKGIKGHVAGQADVLLAHDINMGNAIYKSLQIWVKAVMAGVVVGSKTPVVVPSRVDSPESKLQSIGLAILLMSREARA
ncbi:MAG: phosphate butyryltransferase [Verrucomicrobia bacterium]|nr:phosphate butyryltransferase [Verrucomicrobiota bacterium]